MASSILQHLLESILADVIGWICYQIGRVTVALISFGRWDSDPMKTKIARRKLKLGGLYHVRVSRVHITAIATQFIGLLTIILAVVGAVSMK